MQHFVKYHGAGNDFVMIDNRDGQFCKDVAYVHALCHRRTGIGADGLITIEQSHENGIDFVMHYFNSDGKEGSMCGNGGRCAVAFAKELNIIGQSTTFKGIDGIHQAEILSHNGLETIVKLQMTDVLDIKTYEDGYFLNTGSPHFVKFVSNIQQFPVYEEGNLLRHDARFTGGTNVDFVETFADYIFVRTFERGVEDETLSCGTGVTASALVYALHNNTEHVNIHTLGGEFQVYLQKVENKFTRIFLQGPTHRSFQGIL